MHARLSLLTLLALTACPAKDDTGETDDSGDSGDSADSGETGDSGDSGDTDDSADSGDTNDSGDSGETGDSADTGPNEAPSLPVVHLDPAEPEHRATLTLVVDTPSVDPDGDPVLQTTRWYVDDAYNASFDDATTIPGKFVDAGEVWLVEVGVTDGTHEVQTVTASVTVANRPPDIDSVTVSPSDPVNDDDLRVRVRASDPDGDTLTTSYRWYRDGVEVKDLRDTDVVPADHTSPGEMWVCVVDVSDGHDVTEGESEPVTVATPSTVWYGWRASATLTPDGAGGWSTMVGDTSVLLRTTGTMYGTVDCGETWEVVDLAPVACPRCDFAFSADYTRDAAASTSTTPGACASLQNDATGSFELRGGEFSATLYGTAVSVYYYGAPYAVVDPAYFYSAPGSGYYGYYGATRYWRTSFTVDAYGYGQLDVYTWQYFAGYY